MSNTNDWRPDLEEYIKQGEPDRVEKSEAWLAAIGLQAVDGLNTSKYLLETAKEHIEGKTDIDAVQKRIRNYYKEPGNRASADADAKEADIVSSGIAALLVEKTFQFSPAEFLEIHHRLFAGVYDHAGQIRPYNITKDEWVLKGETVVYASYGSIRATLDYDFHMEKNFSYKELSIIEVVKHIAGFTAGIWQIHPFCEGNTRATAVFIIKYLKTFGFRVSIDVFSENSMYFRNALVRANYNDIQNGIHATTKYLELFFENLLMERQHVLKNRCLHLDYTGESREDVKSAMEEIEKYGECTLNCTLDELAILRIIVKEPSITQKELALRIGKSERTVKTITVNLKEKGYLLRLNGKRTGYWQVLVEVP